MLHVSLVALGGAIGSVLRYLVGAVALRITGHGFPWGTMIVNVVGSFAIGVLAELIVRKYGASAEMRLFYITGILGGFTTFSAFSLDAVSLYERGATLASFGYVTASLCLSIGAVVAGLTLVRSLAV